MAIMLRFNCVSQASITRGMQSIVGRAELAIAVPCSLTGGLQS